MDDARRAGDVRAMDTAIALALVLFGGFGLVKVAGHVRRWRGRRRVGAAPLVRERRGVDLRITLWRTRGWLGLEPGRAHPARADLLLTADRFLVASDLGVLADVGPGAVAPLRSARCTGPSRLVLEGDVPGVTDAVGRWRMELVLEDAPAWATTLTPFVTPDDDGPRFGSLG